MSIRSLLGIQGEICDQDDKADNVHSDVLIYKYHRSIFLQYIEVLL